jgi:hypothetical protein
MARRVQSETGLIIHQGRTVRVRDRLEIDHAVEDGALHRAWRSARASRISCAMIRNLAEGNES